MDHTLTDVQDMRAEIAEYYECAGFADAYERITAPMTDEEVIEKYKELIKAEEKE